MKNTMLVTGATGFVGSALVLELLMARPDARVFCIAREGRRSATERVRRAIARAAAAYAPHIDADAVVLRAFGLRGDLAKDRLGLSEADVDRLSGSNATVWHCAASLADSPRDWPILMETNVSGTRRALQLSRRIGADCFNYMSTAYVAGIRHGVLAEAPADDGGFNNHYELSKAMAELEVRDWTSHCGTPHRILRPSIVVPHSLRGTATGANGALGWILKLAELSDFAPELSHGRPLHYVANGDATLNTVPVDSVVEDCVAIDDAGLATHNRVFHLTNRSAPTIRWFAQSSAAQLGIDLRIADNEDDLDATSSRFHAATRFERPYVSGPDKCFARDEGERHYVSRRGGDCRLSDVWLRRVLAAAQSFRAQSKQKVAS